MFSYTDIHIFDKNGHEIPISYSSAYKVVVPNKYGDHAVFYPVTNPEHTIDGYYAKSFGGRYSASDYETIAKNDSYRGGTADFNYDFNMDFLTENEALASAAVYTDGSSTISTVKIPLSIRPMASSEGGEFYIDGIGNASAEIGDTNVFPSVTFKGKFSFDKVSTELVETQSLYILTDYPDVLGTHRYSKLSEYAETDQQCSSWISRYKLMFLIDSRKDGEFRMFTESNDEVVWSDRKIVDFTAGDYRVDIGFTGSNEGFYDGKMYVCLIDTDSEKISDDDPGEIYVIGELDMSAETVDEDERYRTLFENFGIPDPITYSDLYKDIDDDEGKMDMIALNKHSKQMFLSYPDIFPYVGSYKALINALSSLGYSDIFFKEWYKEIGKTDGKYVAYDMVYKSKDKINTISSCSLEERIHLKKLNWLSMMYRVNQETSDPEDRYGFPTVTPIDNYGTSGSIVKLISLKKWLEKYVLGLNCRIIDIGSEGVYFERYQTNGYGTIQQNIDFHSTKNLATYIGGNSVDTLVDGSTNITVCVDQKNAASTLEDYRNYRLIDFATGTIKTDGTYSSEIIDSSLADVYVGSTLYATNDMETYRASVNCDCNGFIFGSSFIDSESPAVEIRDGKISFLASDLVSKDKNTAFKKLPTIVVKKGKLTSSSDSYEIALDSNNICTIYSTSRSETSSAPDFLILVPPTYEDGGTYVDITPVNGSATRYQKTYTPDIKFDFSASQTQKSVYTKNTTTYGFRYTVSDDGIPYISICGYQTSTSDGFRIGTSEYKLDIDDGYIEFSETDGRDIIVKFSQEDDVTKVTASCKYISDYVHSATYGKDSTFHHFYEGNDYSEFVSEYKEDPDTAISYNSEISLLVKNTGTYTANVVARDFQNNVYISKSANSVLVELKEPSLITYTNDHSADGCSRLGSNTALANKFVEYCILDYTPMHTGISRSEDCKTFSFTSGIDLDSVPEEGMYARFSSNADKFSIAGIDRIQEMIEGSGAKEYYIILKKASANTFGRFSEYNDESALKYAYNNGLTDIDAAGNISTILKAAHDSMNDILNVNLIFYNSLGRYPIMQVPATMACGYPLSDEYKRDEYHVYIPDNVEDYYVWIRVPEDEAPDVPELLTFKRDSYVYYAVTYKPDGNGKRYYVKASNQDFGTFTASHIQYIGDVPVVDSTLEEIMALKTTDVYVQPTWRIKSTITNIDDGTITLQYQANSFYNIFHKDETVKLMLTSADNEDYIAQAAYNVNTVNHDGNTVILDGTINESYIADIDTRTIMCSIDISASSENYGLFRVCDGYLESRTTTSSSVWTRTRTYMGINYDISARYSEDKNMIYYTVYAYDKNTKRLYPLRESDTVASSEVTAYVAYAHDALAEYDMKIESVDVDDGTVSMTMEDTFEQSVTGKYIDDMFSVTYTDFDVDNALKYWMESSIESSGVVPVICQNYIYKYTQPVTLYKDYAYAVFEIDFDSIGLSEDDTYVTWNVYRRNTAKSDRELFFVSNNKTLYTNIAKYGVYDIECIIRDANGNISNAVFKSALTVKNEKINPSNLDSAFIIGYSLLGNTDQLI